MNFKTDVASLKHAIENLISGSGLDDDGLIREPEFIRICMHAAAYRFGLAIELICEAIAEAKSDGDQVIGLDHFAAAYVSRTDCDEELNPFISDHWRGIDATRAMERCLDDQKGRPPRKRRK